MAVFHSGGTNTMDIIWVKRSASGLARLDLIRLNNSGESPSGPEERFGLSLFMTKTILRSSNSTVSMVASQ